MLFLTADPHFGDENIIKFESRPFASVEEMNNALIKNWNEVVTPADTILVLGDFFAKADKTFIEKTLKALNGKIELVKGNHDTPEICEILTNLNVKVYDYPIIVDGFWMLSHEPMYISMNMPYANVFGHVHNNPMYKTFSPRSACVSTERTNFRPISFDETKKQVYTVA